ncbi:RIO1 family regulatory kinase/ATPase domain-containing protein [Nautilia lithotrophica]
MRKKGIKIRYDIIEKIGEGNRGEVYKAKLEDGRIAAIKWAKNYEIDKEWEILKFLNGLCAPKPIYRGKRYFIMEFVEGNPLKEYIGTKKYYDILKEALYNAYLLDEKGIFHGQLGRYYHILNTKNGIKFIDFERGVFTDNPRNFLQIIGYYLFRDEKYDKKSLNLIANLYKKNRIEALNKIIRLIDES